MLLRQIHYDKVILVNSLDKSDTIRKYKIKFYIDDQDECLMNIPNDVTVFKIRNGGNFNNKKWLYSTDTGELI